VAQTKQSASRRKGSSTSPTSRSSKTARSGAGRARSSSNAGNGAGSVKEMVSSGAQGAAQGVATFAKKAKTPLLVGGAGLAGVAGAVVLNARSGRTRKVLGVSLPKPNGFKVDAQKVTEAITDAAKRADQMGQRVSRVASTVQDVSETANAAAKKS
jgi:hypothetical protein